jgi:hypothetical protein
MIYGLDQLGAVKYSDLAAREHPLGWMFGTFTNTFGDALPVVTRVAQEGRASGIRLNLAWSDTHTFKPSDFPKIAREARRFAPIIKRFPGLKWYVSGATEHQLTEDQSIDLYKLVGAELPDSAIYVNQPWQGKGSLIHEPYIVNEVHGADAKRPNAMRYAFSCDGSDCFDFDIKGKEKQFEGAEYFMMWTSQCNGRMKADDKTPRPQRKAWPTGQLIDAMIYLHRDPGIGVLPKGYLIKPKSDQHMVPAEPRALKPVIICPVKADRLELVADNGQVIHVSSKAFPFADGRFRYYFDQYGYQIAEKAVRIHGKPTASLRVGRKIVGTLNIAFRQGGFR